MPSESHSILSPQRRRSRGRKPFALAVLGGALVSISVTLSPAASHAEDLPAPSATSDPQPAPPPSDEPPEDDAVLVEDFYSSIQVAPAQARPGETVHITGGCPPHTTTVDLTIRNGSDYSSVPFPFDPATGQVDREVVVPADTAPGEYELSFHCSMGLLIAFTTTFTVLDPATTAPTRTTGESTTIAGAPELAATGLPDPTTALALTGILTAFGAAAATVASRRARPRS